ncbi:MAG: hypothetical protein AB9866_10520 [Syntrophobacteraceae bacterium]
MRDESDAPAVHAVRNYLAGVRAFDSVTINESPGNLGLADEIVSGVSSTVNNYGRVIVLEDDIVPSLFFLR